MSKEIDLSHDTYLPKPGATADVERACAGKLKRRLNGPGKSMAFFAPLFVGNFIASLSLWMAHWPFHQHVNAYPELVLTVVGFFGTLGSLAATNDDCDLTKPIIPKNFEQQTTRLSAAKHLLTKRNNIIKNFQGVAPDKVPEITNLLNTSILEIEEVAAERDRLQERLAIIDPSTGDVASTLISVLKEKYQAADTKVAQLETKLDSLQNQSHEAFCALELAKETGRSVSPTLALQTPDPQLDELGNWLAALTQAYTTPLQLP